MAQTIVKPVLSNVPPAPSFTFPVAKLNLHLPIKPWELESLWHGLFDKLDISHDWWHLSIHPDEVYPQIQLKYFNGLAIVMAMGKAAERMTSFFPTEYQKLVLTMPSNYSQPKFKLKGAGLHLLRIWDVVGFKYQVFNLVIGLSDDTTHYDFLTSNRDEKAGLVADLLHKYVGAFLVGIGWPEMTDRVLVKVKKVLSFSRVAHGDTYLDTVTCCFLTNIHLPDWTGLGFGAEHGLGVVREDRVK